MSSRHYLNGAITQDYLAAKLDAGLVLTDLVRGGHSGGDVAYFREGTPAEIADCRARLEAGKASKATDGC